MNFCPNCGAKQSTINKFCTECGAKIENVSSNKIDKSVDKALKNLENIAKEVESSEYVNKTIDASKNSLHFVKELLINIFAYLGIIIIFFQLFNYIFSDINVDYITTYQELFNSNYYDNKFERVFIYLARILPSTILPIIFIYLYSKRADWMKYVFGVTITGLIISGLNSRTNNNTDVDNSTVLENSYKPSPEHVEKTVNEDTLNSKYEDNASLIDKENYKYLEGDFTFNSIKYSYTFKCLMSTWGNTDLKVYRNGILYFESEYNPYNCEIYKITRKGNYFCFEIHTVGGTNGMEHYTYYLLDLRNKELHELEKYYPAGDDENYTLYGLEKIKKNTEVYNILKSKIKI